MPSVETPSGPATANPSPSDRGTPWTFAGLSPSSLVLLVAVTCGIGMVWGAVDGNWVLFATELPSVVALGFVWALTRRSAHRSRTARAAALIGLLCAVEVWAAMVLLDARGLLLAVIVAASSAVMTSVAVGWWLWKSTTRTAPSLEPVVCTLRPRERADRELDWSELSSLALSSERVAGGVVSTYPLELEAQVTALADQESSCCGTWLNSSVRTHDGVVWLELTTASPEGLSIIISMAGFES